MEWITDREPDDNGIYIATISEWMDFEEVNRFVDDMVYLEGQWQYGNRATTWQVVAWMPQIEPYVGDILKSKGEKA